MPAPSKHGATCDRAAHYALHREAEALCERAAFVRSGQIAAEGTPTKLGRVGEARLEDSHLELMRSVSSTADMRIRRRRGTLALAAREARRMLSL